MAQSSKLEKLAGSGHLRYRPSLEGEWQRLANPGQSTKPFNADIVLDGGIAISQKIADPKSNGRDVARWTIRYDSGCFETLGLLHYDAPTDNENSDRQSAKIHIRCHAISSSKDTSTTTGSRVADASQFPINTCSNQFHEVEIVFDERTKIKNWSYHVALTFLSGQAALTPKNDGHLFVTAQLSAVAAEAAANEALIKMYNGCRAMVSVFRDTSLLLQIWPPTKPDDIDTDFDTRQFAKRYTISGLTLFRPENASQYPIPGVLKTETWQAIYVPLPEVPAPVTALVLNYISPSQIKDWQGKSEPILRLVPVSDDPSTVRGSTATMVIKPKFAAREIEDIQRLIPSLDIPTLPSTSLPMRNLFLDNHPAITEDELFLDRDVQISKTVPLNESQRSGIMSFYRKRISIIHGPPATGKSYTLAYLMEQSLRDAPQTKILVCAPTNGAVDEILKKAVSVFTKDSMACKFVRLFSEAHIEAQYIQRDERVRSDYYHIQRIRAHFASEDPDRYRDFITGQTFYESTGRIADPDIAERYGRSRQELTQMIMTEASIMFCTCTAAALKAISDPPYWQWPASVCLIEDAGVAKPYEIFLPLVAVPTIQRLVLAGDPFQLGPTILSEETRQIWRTTTLAKAIDKGWPTTLLDVQYRAHDQLYRHTSEIFYAGKVRSHFPTSSPRPFLTHFMKLLPITVPTNQKRFFKLRSWAHFLNVADGSVQSVPGGSYSNPQEAMVTQSLVQTLLLHIPAVNILVLTAYRRQLQLLKELARQNGWNGVDVKTLDALHGAERQVVILNTVRPRGAPGSWQTGGARMSARRERWRCSTSWASGRSSSTSSRVSRFCGLYCRA